MRVKAIRFVCTRLLLYPGFDNAFVNFYPCVLVPMEKKFYYLFTSLGLVCRVKTLLYTGQPQEGKKHVYYIFADCDDVPVIVII